MVAVLAITMATVIRSALASCGSAITASRVSQLALVRSNPVSIVLLCHNHALGASVFQRNRGLAKFASSTLNSYQNQGNLYGAERRQYNGVKAPAYREARTPGAVAGIVPAGDWK